AGNSIQRLYAPPGITARRGGCVIKKIWRSQQNRRSRGGFPFVLNRKTTPASRSADAAQHFTGRSASPPCSDARRGIIALRQIRTFFHCSYEAPFFPITNEYRQSSLGTARFS